MGIEKTIGANSLILRHNLEKVRYNRLNIKKSLFRDTTNDTNGLKKDNKKNGVMTKHYPLKLFHFNSFYFYFASFFFAYFFC